MCEFIKEKVEMETPTAVVGVFFVFFGAYFCFVFFFETTSTVGRPQQRVPGSPEAASRTPPPLSVDTHCEFFPVKSQKYQVISVAA